nr:MAG TPA: hypothetical protein [Caudoviricetes sp.]
MSSAEKAASVHERAMLAAMDCAADELRDALNDADQCGAWDVPTHRRDAEQDEAVIRVQEAQEALEEYLECFISDRYGLDSCVKLEVNQ